MALLTAESIAVMFGGLTALDDFSFRIDEGQIVGLIGPNGAGKSTALNVVSGIQRPKRGRIVLDSRDITVLPPHRRARLGMARTFQRLELWTSMTVRDNIRAAAELSMGWRTTTDPVAMTDRLISRLGLRDVSRTLAGELPSGLGRVVEVARAMASEPRVLLLDEPSAGLDTSESHALGDLLVELAADGTAILLVEHHMELVMTRCSHVYVLDFGRLIADGTPDVVRQVSAVREAYLGAKHAHSA
jgi:branched-chain amino acid transport system ATP-binding protein